MRQTQKNAFIEWLDRELADRGWSDNQLAKKAGISHSVISKARAGFAPKWEACEAIADALQQPAEVVFRRAGLLAALPEDDISLTELRHIFALLPEKDRQELVHIARLKLKLKGIE